MHDETFMVTEYIDPFCEGALQLDASVDRFLTVAGSLGHFEVAIPKRRDD